jgi:hypothetical protein
MARTKPAPILSAAERMAQRRGRYLPLLRRIKAERESPDAAEAMDDRDLVYFARDLLRESEAKYDDGFPAAALALLELETRDDLRYMRINEAEERELRARRSESARRNFGHGKKKR